MYVSGKKIWPIDPQYAGVCNAWFWELAGLRFCRGIIIFKPMFRTLGLCKGPHPNKALQSYQYLHWRTQPLKADRISFEGVLRILRLERVQKCNASLCTPPPRPRRIVPKMEFFWRAPGARSWGALSKEVVPIQIIQIPIPWKDTIQDILGVYSNDFLSELNYCLLKGFVKGWSWSWTNCISRYW